MSHDRLARLLLHYRYSEIFPQRITSNDQQVARPQRGVVGHVDPGDPKGSDRRPVLRRPVIFSAAANSRDSSEAVNDSGNL